MKTEDERMRDELGLWVASELKVIVAVFFRKNPGMIDSLESLSQRLAIPAARLRPELEDHVKLGILRERKIGETTVYMLNRRRMGEIEGYVERLAARPGGA